MKPDPAVDGPEAEQQEEREPLAVGMSEAIGILPGGFFDKLLHAHDDRQEGLEP